VGGGNGKEKQYVSDGGQLLKKVHECGSSTAARHHKGDGPCPEERGPDPREKKGARHEVMGRLIPGGKDENRLDFCIPPLIGPPRF